MGKLSAKTVEKAKPGRHADGDGLYLLVKPSGTRSWVLRIVSNGRRRDFGLGSVSFTAPPPAVAALPLGQRQMLSLQEAREKASEGRRFVKSGLDPAVEWKKERGAVLTFEQVARRYHEAAKSGWKNGKHGDQWLSTLEAHAFPDIGAMRVDHIEAEHIQKLLMPIWLALPETARRVRQRVIAVLDDAHAQKDRPSPAPRYAVKELMKKIRQPKRGPGFAAMPYKDLPAFMATLRGQEPTIGRLALQFLILTAARSGEVRGALWEEVDLDNKLWSIPGERMKVGEPHSVPLTTPAVDILKHVRGLIRGRPGEVIFPGLKGKPLSDATLAKVLRVAGGDKYTVHGFRSSFRDWVAEQTSFPGDWAEAALAHAIPNKTEAAYKRTKFLDQRRKLMAAWADYLGGATNVVQLAAAQ